MFRALGFTVLAWIVGLYADANIHFNPNGYLMLRIILPMLVLGGFILAALNKKE
jgi:hypothetical protein